MPLADSSTPPSSVELTIQGIAFRAPVRYAEGHVIDANEASVLNAVFHDNLRNNFAKVIKAKQAEWAEAGPSAEQRASLEASFATYAESYSFANSAARRNLLDPVERAARNIAKGLVTEAAQAKGIKVAELAEGVFDSHVAKVMQRPEVRAEAQRRVDATKAIVSDAMDF